MDSRRLPRASMNSRSRRLTLFATRVHNCNQDHFLLGIALCMHANQWLRCTGGMMIDSYCHEDRCVAIPDLYMALTHCCKMSLYTAHETLCRHTRIIREGNSATSGGATSRFGGMGLLSDCGIQDVSKGHSPLLQHRRVALLLDSAPSSRYAAHVAWQVLSMTTCTQSRYPLWSGQDQHNVIQFERITAHVHVCAA